MQRCLAKAISLHGIGLYIYAGEDLPKTDEPTHLDTKVLFTPEVQGWVERSDFKSLHEYCEHLKPEEKLRLWQSFNSKTKMALKEYTYK
jgi:hypothetical protein